jgi:hypothetical protein
VPATGGARTLAASPVTIPLGGTSLAIAAVWPFHTLMLLPAQAPFRQWYDSTTAFAPAASQVSEPWFVKVTDTGLLDPAVIVEGVVCAPHSTTYAGDVTDTVFLSIAAPCHENQVRPSWMRSYCRQ